MIVQILKFDVIVVGGGLEAALCAYWAQRLKLRVAMISRDRPQDPPTPYDCWTCSPFLYSHQEWEDIQSSLSLWRDWQVYRERAGLALARRETPSWDSLRARAEGWAQTWEPGAFPELSLGPEMGSFYLPKLPVLETAGLLPRLWQELSRQGVTTVVDSPVQLIDWEHDWPTAVTHDTIYRGRRLFLGVPSLLGLPLPELQSKQLWLEGQLAGAETRDYERLATWIHYAKAPLYLDGQPSRMGLVRLAGYAEEAAERTFLLEAAQRWFQCPLQNRAFYDLAVTGPPLLDYHPWRQDCIWMAGLGQTHWPWLPALTSRLLEDGGCPPAELRLQAEVSSLQASP